MALQSLQEIHLDHEKKLIDQTKDLQVVALREKLIEARDDLI